MKETLEPDDGQLSNNFYSPSVMTQIDVIANILSKIRGQGVTYTFSGNDLIITAGTVDSKSQEQILDDLTITIRDVIKHLKEEYKNTTGKVLNIGREESTTFDAVANYNTMRSTLVRLTHVYDLPDSTAEADTSNEKAEIRGNIPVLNPKLKENKNEKNSLYYKQTKDAKKCKNCDTMTKQHGGYCKKCQDQMRKW